MATGAARTEAPVNLPVSLIEIRDRMRPIDPNRVETYRVSMRENGFFGSITVRPMPGGESQRFRLVVGAHRLVAWRAEGQLTIPCQVRILTDDEALQIEIDENLIRPDASPLERAEMVARRFEVWARRFPDRVSLDAGGAAPKRGRPEKGLNLSQFTAGAPETMGFAADTAAQIGLSKATIKRAWSVVSGIPPELRAQLHGTPIARNDAALRQLASVADRQEQARVAQVLIRGETRSVSDARALADGQQPIARSAAGGARDRLAEIKAQWRRLSGPEREAFCDWVAPQLPRGWQMIEERGDA
jgi:ParB family chromosome partitioning protein